MTYKLLQCLLPVDIVRKVFDYSVCYDTTKIHMYKFFNGLNISMMHEYIEPNTDYTKEYIRYRMRDIKRYSCMYILLWYDYYYGEHMRKRKKIIDIFPKINMLLYIEEKINRCDYCINTYDYCSGCKL